MSKKITTFVQEISEAYFYDKKTIIDLNIT